jgi:predicted transcriptional regulator
MGNLMTVEISNDIKKQIFKMISTPGIEIEDIVKEVNLDYETIMKVLSDEYLKSNLDQGRRLCCRF